MFEENSIVRCITDDLSMFIKENSYKIVSKDFEHSKGYIYGIVNDAGRTEYFTQEEMEKHFTNKDVPKAIPYFSNTGTSACTSFDIEDNVNHPSHYNTNNPIIRVRCKCGEIIEVSIECIDVIRNMPTWKGSAIKYLWREGLKKDTSLSDTKKEIEDLKKAIFYINDKIEMLENEIKNKQ